jgi:uncharacterized protein (TIGR01244 family)
MTFALGFGCQQAATENASGAQEPVPAATEVVAEAPQPVPELLPNLREPLPAVISGGQPSPEQLSAARDAGYKTVLNLRLPDERGVADEPEIVTGLGMEYLSLPINGSDGLTRDNAEAFARALETAEYPMIIHCSSGNRIGALFALKAFWVDGASAEEALQIGLDSGLTRLEGAVSEILASESEG